jgi:hypothetical protein
LPLMLLNNKIIWSFWIFALTIQFSYVLYLCKCRNLIFFILEFSPVLIVLIFEIFFKRKAIIAKNKTI